MRGLKTRESERFNRFFQIIQDAAARQHAVFFAFAGDGRDLDLPDLEGEDMMGWLVPNGNIREFEAEWKTSNTEENLERWHEFFCFATWELVDGMVMIHFRSYE